MTTLTRSQPRPPEVELWVTLDRVYTVLSRQITGKIAALDLTAPQYRVLRQLGEAPRTASELAERLGVTAGNLTGILDRLEQQQLVRRERGTDRRSLQICLTPQGDELLQRAVPRLQAEVGALFAGLTGSEVVLMTGLLERLETRLLAVGV